MVERLEELEKRSVVEHTNEHVAMPVSAEIYEGSTRTEQVIYGMYREGGYEDEDFTKQQEELRKLTEAKKYSAARATRDLATADFWAIKPAQEVMQEVQPQKVDALYDAAVARLDKKVQALKDMVAQEKAKLDLPVAAQKERQKIDNKHSKMYNDALKNLESIHGARKSKEETAKKAGVIAARPLVVTRSVEDAEADIAAENRAAAGEGVITPLEATGALIAAGNRINDEDVKEKFDDVEVDKSSVEAGEKEVESKVAVGALALAGAEVEAAPALKEKGLKAWGKKAWNKLTKNEKGEYSKKKLGLLAGAVALVGAGVAVYLHNQGIQTDHHAIATHASDKFNNIFGTNIFKGNGSGQSVVETGQHITQHTQTVTPEHVQTGANHVQNVHEAAQHVVTLRSGMTPSEISNNYVNQAFPNASPAQVDALTSNGWSHLIYSNGFTGADTRSIPANTKFDTTSMVQHINQMASQMGLKR